MFTGIVEHTGEMTRVNGAAYTVRADKKIIGKLSAGTSVSINGVCCTVLEKTRDEFAVEIMPETERKTAFRALRKGSRVNLELPATPQTFLSGHIVQGHVDGVGHVKKIEREGNSRVLTISVPKALSRYIVEKGSITLHGVSLTVMATRKDACSVGIIPYTYEHTALGDLRVGDEVNVEVDVLAKYVEKLSKRV